MTSLHPHESNVDDSLQGFWTLARAMRRRKMSRRERAEVIGDLLFLSEYGSPTLQFRVLELQAHALTAR